ncbi:hypothetical protein VOM14_01560 [Paraburkholderia sp. MPAMCS5]|uniref:hypothetical protein n=1 Tax=Paraburkholderia sp. MPAMCS5 TaxID=3112563 RepID=UPI002E183379|nr:hypothetical protein [Paraburkholderia sp. MPAMCS5]
MSEVIPIVRQTRTAATRAFGFSGNAKDKRRAAGSALLVQTGLVSKFVKTLINILSEREFPNDD